MTDDDLETYLDRLGDLPLVYNGTARPIADLAAGGVVLQLHGGSFAAIVAAIDEVFTSLAGGRRLAAGPGFSELLGILGVGDALATVASYEAEARP